MSVLGPLSRQAKWVSHTFLFPLTYLPFCELANHIMLSYCHTGARESLTQNVEGGVGHGPRAQSCSVENCLLCLGSWLQQPPPLPPFSTLPLALPGWPICSESQANLLQCWPVSFPYISTWHCGRFRGFVTLASRGAGEKMKGAQRNPVSSSCHCSGVARSDSKISAKALYGKWLHGSV